MQEPVKVVILMDGGLINQIITAGPAIDVVIVDYDTEDADENQVTRIDNDDLAYVSRHSFDVVPEFLEQAFEASDRVNKN